MGRVDASVCLFLLGFMVSRRPVLKLAGARSWRPTCGRSQSLRAYHALLSRRGSTGKSWFDGHQRAFRTKLSRATAGETNLFAGAGHEVAEHAVLRFALEIGAFEAFAVYFHRPSSRPSKCPLRTPCPQRRQRPSSSPVGRARLSLLASLRASKWSSRRRALPSCTNG
jgi:hypothetical protein